MSSDKTEPSTTEVKPTETAPEIPIATTGFVGEELEEVKRIHIERIEKLRQIHQEADAIFEEYRAEQLALMKRFDARFQPVYAKRSDVIMGVVDPATAPKPKADGTTPADKRAELKGVPEFWLTAIKNNRLARQFIVGEHDEEALQYLQDISGCYTDKGFKLTFKFAENPFFTNTTLEKEFAVSMLGMESETEFQSASGATIDWKAGKNLTVKMVTKKQKGKGGKKRTVTKEEKCETFFNFFDDAVEPEDKEDEEACEEAEERLQVQAALGFELLHAIIPRALDYFLNLVPDEDDDFDGEEEEEGSCSSCDGHDDDDDEDDGKKKKNENPAAPAAPAQDCKQQ